MVLKEEKISVIVDSREFQSRVTKHLKDLGVEIKQKKLDVGDYICSDRVGVERKSIRDFLQSIIDQRLFNQICNLSDSFSNPVLILEGNPELLFLERNIHENAIRGLFTTIAVDFKIPIIWTLNSRETAAQIFWIAKKEQIAEKREIKIRCNKKALTLSKQQEYLVAGLPNINTKLSKRLLKKFKTPRKVFSASEEKLMKIEGIGKEKAKKILELLTTKYE